MTTQSSATSATAPDSTSDNVNVLIQLPDSPEEVGVVLPSAQLRNINFSALEFDTARRMAIEYIKTYYPNDFNDFILSNGTIMFVELVSAMTGILSERADILVDESFLPTAQSITAVSNHLELIGQSLTPATAASVNLECAVDVPSSFDVTIQAGLTFSLTGPDGGALIYELFRTAGDYNSDIVIPRGKRGIIGFALEGQFGSDITQISDGTANQFVDIILNNVLNDPILVYIETGSNSVAWTRIDFLAKANAGGENFQVQRLDDRVRVLFGDNINGKIPIDGQVIRVRYRIGGGIRGRIGTNSINESRTIGGGQSASVSVTFSNPSPSQGGYDQESISDAKVRAPREFSTHNNITTSDDYSIVSSTFSHPVYGSVAKSVAVVRTGIEYGNPADGTTNLDNVIAQVRAAPTVDDAKQYMLANYVNKNIVDMYLLQNGVDLPVVPNIGLKTALQNFISTINVFTDELRIHDGSLLPINIEAVVVLTRNADATATKNQVLAAINAVFDVANRNMGQEFNMSDLTFAIRNVVGVKSVDLFQPTDDYPSLGTVVTKDQRTIGVQGVGINELVVLGSQQIQFYFEQGNINI